MKSRDTAINEIYNKLFLKGRLDREGPKSVLICSLQEFGELVYAAGELAGKAHVLETLEIEESMLREERDALLQRLRDRLEK